MRVSFNKPNTAERPEHKTYDAKYIEKKTTLKINQNYQMYLNCDHCRGRNYIKEAFVTTNRQ